MRPFSNRPTGKLIAIKEWRGLWPQYASLRPYREERMNDDADAPVPEVPADSFRLAYDYAEDGVLRNPAVALDLADALRPTIRIARTIARGLPVSADELYAISVRVCALWRLLASEPAELRPLGIGLTEEGIRCPDKTRTALLDAAAAAPISDDLRFEPDGFLAVLKDRMR